MKKIYSPREILIGESAHDNWDALKIAKGFSESVIFHLSSLPSCYVIVLNGKNLEKEEIYEIACICLKNTKYKDFKNVKVDYSPVSNVKKGEKLGEYFYKSQSKVKIITV